jgi:hypothetical protein
MSVIGKYNIRGGGIGLGNGALPLLKGIYCRQDSAERIIVSVVPFGNRTRQREPERGNS